MKPSTAMCLFAMALPWPAAVAGDAPAAAGTLVELRVDAQRKVANDLGRAVVFVEAAGAEPAELARRVKERLAEGLAIAKHQAGVSVQSGATHTWPVQGRGGAIEGWRMRSELVIESADAAVLSALVGRLQKTMAVAGITFQPSPEARRRAEEEAELEAIDRFRDKARRVAAVFKQPYRIRRMSINAGGGGQPPMPLMRGAAMEAAMPLEAGESTVSVAVEGQIELPAEPPR